MSKIKTLLQTDISSLIAKSKAFGVVEHGTTKGSAREELLVNSSKI